MHKIWQYFKDIGWAMHLHSWRHRILYLRLRFAELFLGWKGEDINDDELFLPKQ
jgi:hypothetical protein